MKIVLSIIFILGLLYLVAPGPDSIHDFPPLPNSLKSDEPGDTIQNPNNSAYFSDFRRQYVTNYYKDFFQKSSFWGFGLPSVRLNHPPEEAYQYIRDQQKASYLESFSYPLRNTIFVNGYEPFSETGKPFERSSTNIKVNNTIFESKTTLRYYDSNIFWRIIVYLGIWVGFWLLLEIYKKALRDEYV